MGYAYSRPNRLMFLGARNPPPCVPVVIELMTLLLSCTSSHVLSLRGPNRHPSPCQPSGVQSYLTRYVQKTTTRQIKVWNLLCLQVLLNHQACILPPFLLSVRGGFVLSTLSLPLPSHPSLDFVVFLHRFQDPQDNQVYS